MALLSERLPSSVWTTLQDVFAELDIPRTAIFVRDTRNMKLWSRAYVSDREWGKQFERGAWPLYADEKPDFALSVQTGRIVQRKGDKVYLPAPAVRGRVSIVIVCELGARYFENDYKRRIALRSLWGLFMAIQPAIALAVERQLHRENTRLVRKTEFLAMGKGGAQTEDSNLVDILRKVGCASVTVLNRWGEKWFVAKDHVMGAADAPHIDWAKVFEDGDVFELDRIANHPTRRGLVLDDDDLERIFIRFRAIPETTTSVYMMPVWRHHEHVCHLVAFSFIGEQALRVNGVRQSELSKVAPFLAAVAA